MKKILPILIFLSTQCQIDTQENYSAEMIEYVDSMGTEFTGNNNHGFQLRNDSILQIMDSRTFLLKDISTGLDENKTYGFQNDQNVKLEIRRLNFTDLEVVIQSNQNTYISKASMTLDVLQHKKVIEFDSNYVEASSFDLMFGECKATMLLTKPSKDNNELRILTLQIDENCSNSIDEINGQYHEK